jgi:hypothetical protein
VLLLSMIVHDRAVCKAIAYSRRWWLSVLEFLVIKSNRIH